jgi:hypothetical protein
MGNTQMDRKAPGFIYAAVLEKTLSARLGIKVRVELLQTDVPHSFDGTIVMAGFSKSFGGEKNNYDPSIVDEAMSQRYGRWSIAAGATQPNSANGKMSLSDYEVERTEVTNGDSSGLVYSGILKHEGNSHTPARNGVAALVGYEFKSPNGMVAGGEAGPYLEHDFGYDRTKVDALSRLYIGRQIKKIVVTLVYERVSEFSKTARDADGMLVEVGRKIH